MACKLHRLVADQTKVPHLLPAHYLLALERRRVRLDLTHTKIRYKESVFRRRFLSLVYKKHRKTQIFKFRDREYVFEILTTEICSMQVSPPPSYRTDKATTYKE